MFMIRRLAASAAALALAGCSTYSSSAATDWEDRPTERRGEVRVVAEELAGPPDAPRMALYLGAEPALEIALTGPVAAHVSVETWRSVPRVRRRAEATLVVKNA